MYTLTVNLSLLDVTLAPTVLSISAETLRKRGCTVLSRPSWLIASCGDVLVKTFFSTRKGEAPVVIEGVIVIELSGENPEGIVRILGEMLSAVEPLGARAVMSSV